MNNFDLLNLNSLFSAPALSLIFKIFFLLADLFAIIFLIVVVKQVFSMDHIVHDSNDALFIKTFAFMLLFIAVSLFLISLVIL